MTHPEDKTTMADDHRTLGHPMGRRGFLTTTGKVLAGTATAGLLGGLPRLSVMAESSATGQVPPYAPLTPPTAAETASWFNPKTDAKWLKNPITVHVSSWWAPQPEISGAEAAFNKIFTPKTGITVIYDFIGTNYDAKVLTRIAAGNPYDVITFNANSVGPYVDKGVLTPIELFMKRDHYSLDDFFSFARDEFTYKAVWGGSPMTSAASICTTMSICSSRPGSRRRAGTGPGISSWLLPRS